MEKIIKLLVFCGCFVLIGSRCTTESGDTDKALFDKSAAIMIVDPITKKNLVGKVGRPYHPDSIVVYDENMNKLDGKFSLCTDHADSVYVSPSMLGHNGFAEESVNFKATYYLRFPENDFDTLKISYQYRESFDFYVMYFDYNGFKFNGIENFGGSCQLFVPKYNHK